MHKPIMLEMADAEEQMSKLFEHAPLLVEVSFHQCGTSSDWYLCQDRDEFEALVKRLPKGRDLYVTSVWNITNRETATRVRT